MTRNKSNLNVESNGNGGKITTNNPTDISAVLDAKPDYSDPDVEFDVSTLNLELTQKNKLDEYAEISGIPSEKLAALILEDSLEGTGETTQLIKKIVADKKEKERQAKLKIIAQEKLKNDLEMEKIKIKNQELEVQAKAIACLV